MKLPAGAWSSSHPLQPFDARNFIPGKLVASGPWSFDKANLEGARAAAARDDNPESALFLPGSPRADRRNRGRPSQPRDVSPVSGERVLAAAGSGSTSRTGRSDVDDSLPVELDSLREVGIRGPGARPSFSQAVTSKRASQPSGRGGFLPPGSLCDSLIDQVVPDLEALVAVGSDDRSPTSVSVNVILPSGTTVVGTVPSIRGDAIHTVTYSKMSPSLRIVGVAASACSYRRDTRAASSRLSPLHVGRTAVRDHRYRSLV